MFVCFSFRALRISLMCALLSTTLLATSFPLAAQTQDERLQRLEETVEALKKELAEARENENQSPAGQGDRLAELERRLDLIAEELEKLAIGEAAVTATESEYGFGPAASKIYRKSEGLSFGGYGEMLYQGFDSSRDDGAASGKTDELDYLRAILYVGYKFNDRWLFNSEIEFEHASTSVDGSASVEFAYLDYLWKEELNARAGILLVPMGFVNELHEPTTFLGAKRPDTERVIIPSTWRENGLGIFGDVGGFSYRTYVLNGLKGSGFSSSGLRGGRQKGSKADAENLAWVGRLDYTGKPGFLAGVSAYFGNSGQDLERPGGGSLGLGTTILEGHLEWRWKGLEARALYAHAELDDVAELNEVRGFTGNSSVGEELDGYYLQLGYDVLANRGGNQSLIPFVRYEAVDTQAKVPFSFTRNPARDTESLTLGLSFKPIDQVVIKADYQDYDNGAGTGVDQFNVLLGYIF